MYYPSCSELVVMLGLTDIGDIKRVLRRILHITKSKLVASSILKVDSLYPNADVVISISQVISPDDIVIADGQIGLPLEKVKNKLCKLLYKKTFTTRYIEIIPVYVENKKTGYYLRVEINSEAGGHGLQFYPYSDADEESFPALTAILEDYYGIAKWRTYDGGSPSYFVRWSKRNGKYDLVKQTYMFPGGPGVI
jgi:hypothetical protein